MSLSILDAYGAELSFNGDRGNVEILERRATWAGVETELLELTSGGKAPKKRPDIIHLGGGSVPALAVVRDELERHRATILEWLQAGSVLLAVAGGFALSLDTIQLPAEARASAGLGVFAGQAVPRAKYFSGKLLVSSPFGRLVGQEHGTLDVRLAAEQERLGAVLHGRGNDGTGSEGCVAFEGRAIGSNLHGPTLAYNSKLADHILATATGLEAAAFSGTAQAVAADRLAAAAAEHFSASLG